MMTLPALSTPCTWNTFLARSTPMVLICMWTPPLVIRCSTITLWHIRCRERASSTTSFASLWPWADYFRSSPASSTDRCNTFCELLSRRLIEQGLSGPFIELSCDGTELGLAVQRQIGATRKILAQQSVGVFV